MLFFKIRGRQGKQFYDGEFSPYPRDLGELILEPAMPENICVKVVRGGQPGDMMFAAFNVVSDRFVEVLRSIDATGYVAHPIRVIAAHRDGQVIPGYSLIKLRGHAEIDEKASNLRRTPSGIHFDRLVMDESTWDRTDVFAVGEGIAMYVVERVAKALRKAKLRNVEIIENTQCRV